MFLHIVGFCLFTAAKKLDMCGLTTEPMQTNKQHCYNCPCFVFLSISKKADA